MISKSEAIMAYRRLINTADIMVQSLTVPPKTKIREYDGETIVDLDTTISLNVVKRSQIHDCMQSLKVILDACREDKDFD